MLPANLLGPFPRVSYFLLNDLKISFYFALFRPGNDQLELKSLKDCKSDEILQTTGREMHLMFVDLLRD